MVMGGAARGIGQAHYRGLAEVIGSTGAPIEQVLVSVYRRTTNQGVRRLGQRPWRGTMVPVTGPTFGPWFDDLQQPLWLRLQEGRTAEAHVEDWSVTLPQFARFLLRPFATPTEGSDG
jgi:hypothetical protein